MPAAKFGKLKGYPAKMTVLLHGRDSTMRTAREIVGKIQAAIAAKGLDAVVKVKAGPNYSYADADIHATDFDTLDAAMEAAISTGLVEDPREFGGSFGSVVTDHPAYMKQSLGYLKHEPGLGSRGGWEAGARAKYVSESVKLTESRLRQIIREEVAALRRR